MKLLTRLRDLRKENITESKNVDTLVNNQHQNILGVGTTTVDDILRLDIANTHHHSFYYEHQD